MSKSAEEIAKKLLEKLIGDEIIGGRHTAFENLPKGFPKHLRAEVKGVAEDLIRSGFIARKATSYGLQVFLDPKMMSQIEAKIRDP